MLSKGLRRGQNEVLVTEGGFGITTTKPTEATTPDYYCHWRVVM